MADRDLERASEAGDQNELRICCTQSITERFIILQQQQRTLSINQYTHMKLKPAKAKKPVTNSALKVVRPFRKLQRAKPSQRKPILHIAQTLSVEPIYTGGRIQSSQDQNTLGCICNGDLKLFSWAKGQLAKISLPQQDIFNFCWHPDSLHIFTFTTAHLLRLHHIQSQSVLKTLKLDKQMPLDMKVHPQGKILAMGMASGYLRILNMQLNQLTNFKSNNPIRKLCFDTEGKYIVYFMDQDGVRAFDIQLNSVVYNFKYSGVSAFALGQTLVLSLSDKLLSFRNSQLIKQTPIQETEIKTLQFFGKDLIIGGKQLFLMNSKQILPIAPIQNIDRVLVLPNSKKIVVITEQQIIHLLAMTQSDFQEERVISGYNDEITETKFLTDQPNKAIISTNSSIIKLYDFQGNTLTLLEGHSDIVLALDTRGWFIFSGSKDKKAILWKIEDYSTNRTSLVNVYSGHKDDVTTVAISPDCRHLVTASADLTIKIWSVQSAKSISTTVAHQKSINKINFNKNGSLLLSCSHDRHLKIFQFPTMNVVVDVRQKSPIWDACFFNNSILAVSATCGLYYNQKGQKMAVWGEGAYRVVAYKGGWWTGSEGRLNSYDLKAVQQSQFAQKEGGRIWGLDMSNDRIMAGIGGRIVIFKDVTEQVKLETQDKLMIQESHLNQYELLLQNDRFQQAAFLAFSNGYTHSFVKALERLRCPFITSTLTFNQLGEIDVQKQKNNSEDVIVRLAVKMIQHDPKATLRVIKQILQCSRLQHAGDILLNVLLKLHSLQELLQLKGQEPLEEWVRVMIDTMNRRTSRLQKLLVDSSQIV